MKKSAWSLRPFKAAPVEAGSRSPTNSKVSAAPIAATTFALVPLLMVLAACSAEKLSLEELEPLPVNYREIVATHVRNSFIDPYSIRDASLTSPVPGELYVERVVGAYEKGWLVCLKANAKNRSGGYSGQMQTVMILRGGTVVNSLSGPNIQLVADRKCDKSLYQPYPDIEAKRSG